MFWFYQFEKVFLSLMFCACSACGFQYAYDGEVAKELSYVHVKPMAEREGQIVRLALQRAFNPQNLVLEPRYYFSGSVMSSVTQLMSQNSSKRSAKGTLTLQGFLTDKSGERIWSGSLSRSGLFAQHILPSLSADAQENLWQDLSALIAQDLAFELATVFG